MRVSGELDMLTAPELTADLAGFDGANFTLDLSNFSDLDCRASPRSSKRPHASKDSALD